MAGEGGNQRLNARETIPRPRIQTLSDLIFGLALSIGALTLISEKPSSSVDLAGILLGFGWAFLILALVWVRYTSIMSVLPVETRSMMAANLVLLFLVTVEPYLYNLIAVSFSSLPGQLDSGVATTAYAADMGAMFLVLAFFAHEITIEEKRLVPHQLLNRYKLMRNATVVTAALFLVSILPIFWGLVIFGIQARFILWMGTFVTWTVRRGFERRSSLSSLSGGAQTRLPA